MIPEYVRTINDIDIKNVIIYQKFECFLIKLRPIEIKNKTIHKEIKNDIFSSLLIKV